MAVSDIAFRKVTLSFAPASAADEAAVNAAGGLLNVAATASA